MKYERQTLPMTVKKKGYEWLGIFSGNGLTTSKNVHDDRRKDRRSNGSKRTGTRGNDSSITLVTLSCDVTPSSRP